MGRVAKKYYKFYFVFLFVILFEQQKLTIFIKSIIIFVFTSSLKRKCTALFYHEKNTDLLFIREFFLSNIRYILQAAVDDNDDDILLPI